MQLGTVGSTSDVCGFYVLVLVTNTGILDWNNVNFAYNFAYIIAVNIFRSTGPCLTYNSDPYTNGNIINEWVCLRLKLEHEH